VICSTHNLDLGGALKCPKCEAEEAELRETVLKARNEGKVAMWLLPGQLGIIDLEDFLKQPANGILYDLNRLEEIALSNAPDIRWVNDFAVAVVIRKLVEQRDAAVAAALNRDA
jgi:hypothetical protein